MNSSRQLIITLIFNTHNKGHVNWCVVNVHNHGNQ